MGTESKQRKGKSAAQRHKDSEAQRKGEKRNAKARRSCRGAHTGAPNAKSAEMGEVLVFAPGLG